MAKTRHLTLPLTEEAVWALNVGDQVILSGDIVTTIGMPTHQRLLDCLDAGEPLPVDFMAIRAPVQSVTSPSLTSPSST